MPLSLTPSQAAPAIDGEHCYRALEARDSRFDGVFFTGVKTTGIYCRPICPAKTPRASSCTFFRYAAAAEAAGFRPCLRCRPELAPYALQQNLAHAIWKRIADGALNDISVEVLAQQVGLSSRQMRRVVLQEFGVTPVELAQTQRLLFAKKLLHETSLSLTELAYAAGFGSVRRFNALFLQRYGMAPGAMRRSSSAPGGGICLRLAYRPPYAWDALMQYLRGRAMHGLEAVIVDGKGLAYVRSVRIGAYSGWLKVSHSEKSHQLCVELAPTLVPVVLSVLARIREQFDLEANPDSIEQQLQKDSMLALQLAATPGLRVPGTFDCFELALRAVLGQQVSVAGASTVAGRLVGRFGDVVRTPFAEVNRHFPTPQQLLAASISDLAGLGMPGARAATLQVVAQFALENGFERPGSQDEWIAKMKALRGIGEWTAQYVAMRAMRFPDAFPAGDLGLQKAAAQLAPAPSPRCSEKQLLARSADWSPWRSYAALLLWQSLSADAASAHKKENL
ncbi:MULTISPECIES: AlkA N-terminal domain-containing protein [unclassified Undibacterium]|uniref:AlkA N-terminal domain-containing protein n=1 Tax=unclassified Undibacterium TaxID=2630295 RepID=UPI002AC950C7|nr:MULTISPECIES: AlkA N-terminal domain-containing protein [unclassified Undibacterium]MEB0138849.1 AlkA N-terminal domain-containing protein [Undibacterium sp. CCC2.1]MEB0172289.1 AlkA N-terminal domain-containing protein [Undibacterium sp. CCC1.1]MEB0176094.1 AlkA N-terminal domain-containing protein [Undibacterium sp. CCC3.4]MEB0215945.1 AlkA N-terminal domain-containing protein [Undibacterium sp. 5I2]WPX44764.1 AlkA N-terminal domain-containing protein [Undibacterium sp. CCC3.4]